MKGRHKSIAVFDSKGKFSGYCTKDRMFHLLSSNEAIRLNSSCIRMKPFRHEEIKMKHRIIREAKRICYICRRRIPKGETATVDHVVPRSKSSRADVYENMRCCCLRCNNDKDDMYLSDYVEYMAHHRDYYSYVSDKQLYYLQEFAKIQEDKYG